MKYKCKRECGSGCNVSRVDLEVKAEGITGGIKFNFILRNSGSEPIFSKKIIIQSDTFEKVTYDDLSLPLPGETASFEYIYETKNPVKDKVTAYVKLCDGQWLHSNCFEFEAVPQSAVIRLSILTREAGGTPRTYYVIAVNSNDVTAEDVKVCITQYENPNTALFVAVKINNPLVPLDNYVKEGNNYIVSLGNMKPGSVKSFLLAVYETTPIPINFTVTGDNLNPLQPQPFLTYY